MLIKGDVIDLQDIDYSVHECPSVLKTMLGHLQEPLVTNACYKAHLHVALLADQGEGEEETSGVVIKQILCTQLLFQLLNAEYLDILKDNILLLHSVSKSENENKMS